MSAALRLIARLDVKDRYLVKGIQYEGLRKLGDPHDFALDYYRQGIDELLYLDTVASLYGRNNLSGILILSKDIANAGEYALPLNDLEAGNYLVNVNNKTIKVFKK